MLANVLLVVLIGFVAVVLGWLARRAWLARNPFIRWIGTVLAGLLALIVGLVAVVAGIGIVKFYTPLNYPVPDIKVEGTPEQIERGRHLASAFCVDCHSTNKEFPLTGGRDLAEDISLPLGSFVSVNLTPAGSLKDWSDGQIFRTLREGVDKDGRRLVVMPSINVRYMSDEDMLAMIAFLRSQEPVENETPQPPDRPNLLAAVLAGANMVPEKPRVTAPIVAPEKAATEQYGRFMTTFLDCKDCHGDDLSGGTSQFNPKGPSLRVVKGWTQEQFIATLRTGIDPGGNQLDPPMPWKASGRLDDVELGALYAYLVSLP